MDLHATASHTVGPFFHIGLAALTVTDLTAPGIAGRRVEIRGRVLDGDGAPVTDALIETWQADAHGAYAHPEGAQDTAPSSRFKGFGRTPTDAAGAFHLTTIVPGPVPGPDGSMQTLHIVVLVFMRGLLKHLMTRIYFPDEPRNADDPILNLVPPERRATLIARQPAADEGVLQWDIVLQGPDETVFFDY